MHNTVWIHKLVSATILVELKYSFTLCVWNWGYVFPLYTAKPGAGVVVCVVFVAVVVVVDVMMMMMMMMDDDDGDDDGW